MNKKILLLLLIFCSVFAVSANSEAASSPSQLIVVRASDDSLWKATCVGTTCSGFSSFPGRFASTPTVVWDDNLLKYVVWGRASDNSMWRATFSKDGTFQNDWVSIPGSTPSQIGAAGSNTSYPWSNWADGDSADVSTISTNCNTMTDLAMFDISPPSDGVIAVFTNGTYAPTTANKWLTLCLSDTGGGKTCNSWYPQIESSSVGPQYEGERRFALNMHTYPAEANTTYYYFLKACRETDATGMVYWDNVMGLTTK